MPFTFINPLMLWVLPAIMIPLIIHLLNRLRYRSVDWAAVMFLVKATRSSTRHARIRQYLILLSRILLVLFLVLALSRPLIGGWLGITIAGAPDTIMILLDRSASMETVDPRQQRSKRAHALDIFRQAGDEHHESSRFLLIENVLCTPQEIAGPASLGDLALTAPTDTAADIPSMLRAAVDTLVRDKTGRTELWLASDLQRSNWRPESREWESLTRQISSLPQDVRIRILDLDEACVDNVSLALHDAVPGTRADARRIDMTLDINKLSPAPVTLPLALVLDGVRSQADVTLQTGALRFSRKIDIPPTGDAGGWGKFELPPDENLHDNASYFVYGRKRHQRAAVVSDDIETARYLRLATAPAPALLNASCDVLLPDSWKTAAWQDFALVIWSAPMPPQSAARLQSYVEAGGVLLCLPPGPASRPPSSPAAGPSGAALQPPLLDIQWRAVEACEKEHPYRITTWEEHEGPLARTADGKSLPVPTLECLRRRLMVLDGTEAQSWYRLAEFSDGPPWLLRRNLGNGTVYVCTSLPRDDWSNLARGHVLVPMIQRLFRQGAERLAESEFATCGDWTPDNPQDTWSSVDDPNGKDPRWQAGVFQCQTRRVALNRPPEEHQPEVLDKPTVDRLFKGIDVQILDKLSQRKTDRLQSEIWRLFVFVALACAIVESALLLQDKTGDKEKKHRLD